MTRPVACLEGAHEQASPGPRRSHKFQLVSDSRPAEQAQVSGLLAMRSQPGVSSYSGQGWQGRGGSPTRAPRPATPGEMSDPRPATPRDPGLLARPGHARSGPEISGPAGAFFRIGIFKLFFDCNISECLQ